jgi:hypothetical protein
MGELSGAPGDADSGAAHEGGEIGVRDFAAVRERAAADVLPGVGADDEGGQALKRAGDGDAAAAVQFGGGAAPEGGHELPVVRRDDAGR